MKNFIKKFLALASLFILAACSASPITDTSSSTAGEVQVGTNVGNPLPPGKNLITFSTQEQTSTTDTCQILPDHMSQACKLSPQKYTMGILAIYLVDCQDDDGVSVTCVDRTYSNITGHTALYEGEVTPITLDGASTQWPNAWSIASENPVTAGGLQVVVSYIGGTLPDDATNISDAAHVIPALRGTEYRICGINSEITDSDLRKTECGLPDAEFGDILFDLNHDGHFAYLDINTLSTTDASETTSRPDAYNKKSTAGLFASLSDDLDLKRFFISDATPLGKDGYYSPIFALSELLSVSAQTHDTTLTATLDTQDTLVFTDGIGWDGAGPTCVESLSDEDCRVDADPSSVGIYDPMFDGFFQPLPANGIVTTN